MKNKNERGKVAYINYEKKAMQEYLKSTKVSIQMKKFIFILRCRMLDISSNYPNQNKSEFCPVCNDSKDTQEHQMTCPELVDDKQLTDSVPRYEELFGENMLKQIRVATIIQENFRLRKKKMKEQISSSTEDPSEPLCSIVC